MSQHLSNKKNCILKFKENKVREFISPQEKSLLLLRNQIDFGLSIDDELVLIKKVESNSSYLHHKYQQFYKDLRVVGGRYTLHERDGGIYRATGNLYPYISISAKPQISLDEAIRCSKNIFLNKVYQKLGQDKIVELNTKIEHSELVIIDLAYPNFSGEYKLAYEIICQSDSPLFKYRYYIDAINRTLISSFTEIAHSSVEGTAHTHYYGTQTIISDSIAPNKFILIDSTRGKGIVTLDARFTNNNLPYRLENIEHNSSNWQLSSEDNSIAALDAHHCATVYHDMLSDKFNWNGIDGDSSPVVSVTNAGGKYFLNAYWNNEVAYFGNGTCDDFGPLTIMDIVGHEFTHGVITHSSDLEYQDESGAINESIADIVGKALEYFYDNENFNWYEGDRANKRSSEYAFRSLKDPHEFNDPKYYLGQYWYTGQGDNGGVHSNSGVMNYWFYLLVEGGTGTTENNESYNVPKIGMEKAFELVFQTNVNYLTPNSRFGDMVQLSLLQAGDLYGNQSIEVEAVKEAWRAVGLNVDFVNYDLSLKPNAIGYNICKSGTLQPDVIIENIGQVDVTPETVIPIALYYNNDTFAEWIYFEEGLLAGENYTYTFNHAFANQANTLNVSFELLVDDVLEGNNSFNALIRSLDNDGVDLELRDFELRVRNNCNDPEIVSARINYRNLGCEYIFEGDSLLIDFRSNLFDTVFVIDVVSDILPLTSFTRIFSVDFDFDGTDIETYTATLLHPKDFNMDNNIESGNIYLFEKINNGYVENFNNPDFGKLLIKDRASSQKIDSVLQYNGNNMLLLSKYSEVNNFDNCADANDFFDENSNTNRITFCVDATDMIEPQFSFDLLTLKQGSQVAIQSNDYRVLIKPTIGSLPQDLIFQQSDGVLQSHAYDLPAGYLGAVTLDVQCLDGYKDGDSIVLDSLDAAIFDNFRLGEKISNVQDEEKFNFNIFPNPFAHSVTIIQNVITTEFDVNVYNVLGKKIYSKNGNSGQLKLNTENYPDGVYLLELRDEYFNIKTVKLIKNTK